MLVLSRKLHEEIHVGSDVVVRVVAVHGNRVRLAIDAPDSVRIRRGELPPEEAVEHSGQERRQLREICA